MRAEVPLHWTEAYGDDKGFWSLTRYADIMAAQRDPDTFSSAQGIRIEDQSREEYLVRRTFQETDPPEHTATRRTVNPAFAKPVVAQFEPLIRDLARDIVNTALDHAKFDGVEHIAKRLPMLMLGRILGVPDADLDWLVERGDALITEMEARIVDVAARLEGVEPIPVFIYNGGEDTPRAVLGNTMLSHVVELAGGENILGDIDNRYGSTSWEQLVAEAPEHIVVFYSGTSSGQVVDDPETNLGQARVATLEANPIIAGVPAVENDAYTLIVSVIGQPGPSSVDALEKLARAFHPDAFE